MTKTTTQRLATMLVGKPIGEWVAQRRAQNMSWRKIAVELHDHTNGQVSVTGETLRLWSESTTEGAA